MSGKIGSRQQSGKQKKATKDDLPVDPTLSDDFQVAFVAHCLQKKFDYIPSVVPRRKLPEELQSRSLDFASVLRQSERLSNLAFFQPRIQVEFDNPEQPESVKGVYIQGWRVEIRYLEVFAECWPRMKYLNTVNLWRTGMTKDTVEYLASFLPKCVNLTDLSIDNNPVSEPCFHRLIAGDSILRHLSLRHCDLDDEAVRRIAEVMRDVEDPRCQPKLVSLNLNGNKIGDRGLDGIVEVLRMNRMLMNLSVGNNKITDVGACRLASVLQPFPLTQQELVKWRQKLRQLAEAETPRQKLQRSRHASVDAMKLGGAQETRAGKGSALLTPAKAAQKAKPEKAEKEKGSKGSKPPSKVLQAKESKEKGLQAKGSKESVTAGTPSGEKKKGQKSRRQSLSVPQDEGTIDRGQLVTEAVKEKGQVVIKGNRAILSVYLAHNRITEAGLRALLQALRFQVNFQSNPDASRDKNMSSNEISETSLDLGEKFDQWQNPWREGFGLMRLCLNGNLVDRDNEVLKEIEELMRTRAPGYTNKRGSMKVEEGGPRVN